MTQKTFSITTTLPYINAEPHIGFANEIIGADVLARYHRDLLNEKVFFNTGTDEHGQKIYLKAKEAGLTPQAFCDQLVKPFKALRETLNLSWTNFVRTTDTHHLEASQEMWRRCLEAGDIYKKEYETKYCVGCEMEKTESELVDGRCPLHPDRDLEIRREENYFFRLSRYADRLLQLYADRNHDFVRPAGRMKEIESLAKSGLRDFSISRLAEKMPWGVPVPDDPEQVMYVWFDALTNYISTFGWPEDPKPAGWPAVQVCGKDNLRQQSAMWQAMLMSAGLPNSVKILINGFINVDGQKMSKSLGNVISPSELVEKFGIDGTRFLLINLGSYNEDVDVSWEKLKTSYTAILSNGLGNLCSRVAKMLEKNEIVLEKLDRNWHQEKLDIKYLELMNNDQISEALWYLEKQINALDNFLSEKQPWMIKDNPDQVAEILKEATEKIRILALEFLPFIPESAEKILEHFGGEKVASLAPLFPRLS